MRVFYSVLSKMPGSKLCPPALAENDRRFGRVDIGLAAIRGELKALEGQVVMLKWITGAIFAGILALILRTFVQG